MPKFYFHVRQRNIQFDDKQGAVFPDLKAAWHWAEQDARALTSQKTLDGPLADHWIEIADEAGAVIASLPFERMLQPN
jgi:hypothetical protein